MFAEAMHPTQVHYTSKVALEIIKEHSNIGILSLPALANKIPRQKALAKQIEKVIVVDGCPITPRNKTIE